MSERMTSISLPGRLGSGIAEYGRKTPAEMIEIIRRSAERQKENAEAILNARDEDFLVQTYVGFHVRRKRETLQKGLAE